MDDEGETPSDVKKGVAPDDDIDDKEGSLDDNIVVVAPDDYNNNEVLSQEMTVPNGTTTRIITTTPYTINEGTHEGSSVVMVTVAMGYRHTLWVSSVVVTNHW